MAQRLPGVAYSVTIRAEYSNEPGMLGKITSVIGEVGGDIEAVDLVESTRDSMIRDLTVNARDVEHGQEIVSKVRKMPGLDVVSVSAGVPSGALRRCRSPEILWGRCDAGYWVFGACVLRVGVRPCGAVLPVF